MHLTGVIYYFIIKLMKKRMKPVLFSEDTHKRMKERAVRKGVLLHKLAEELVLYALREMESKRSK